MKNNDNITKDVESISYWKDLEKEIKWLKNEIYVLVNERDALAKINQQLRDRLEALRNDNLQLIEQIALMHDNKTCQHTMIRYADLSPDKASGGVRCTCGWSVDSDGEEDFDPDDFKRTDQWGSDWLEHDIITARKKCKQCHAATRCADCCFLCENRCDQYQICEVVKQYAVDAAPYDPSDLDLIEAFKSLQTDRTMRLRIANLSDYAYSPVVKEAVIIH